MLLVCQYCCIVFLFFFFKQKTAYEMRISDWSSDVCSSDLSAHLGRRRSANLASRIPMPVMTADSWPKCLFPLRFQQNRFEGGCHGLSRGAGRNRRGFSCLSRSLAQLSTRERTPSKGQLRRTARKSAAQGKRV